MSSPSPSVLEALIRPLDGKVDFSYHSHYFIPWYWNLQKKLCLIGACSILRQHVHHGSDWQEGSASYLRDNIVQGEKSEGEPFNELCSSKNPNFDSDRCIVNQCALFSRALEVVLDSLTYTQAAYVFPIYSNESLCSYQKAVQIVEYFRDLHGTNELCNTKPIINEIHVIPPATDCASAEYLLGALSFWNSALRCIHSTAALSDVALIEILLRKLKASMFAYVVVKINRPGVSFNTAVKHIQSTIVLYKQRALQQEHEQHQENVRRDFPTSVKTCFERESRGRNMVYSSSLYSISNPTGSCEAQNHDIKDQENFEDNIQVFMTTPMKKWLLREKITPFSMQNKDFSGTCTQHTATE